MSRVNVLSARPRQHRPELGERVRTEQRVERAYDPNAEKEPCRWQHRRDVARRAQNAGADRISNSNGKAEADAEDGEELAGHRR